MSRTQTARTHPVICVVLLVTAQVGFAQTGFVNWESPHVHPIDLTPSGGLLLAVNTADNRLEVFDVSSGTPVPIRSIPVGLDPVSVRARTNNEAWVVNHISDSISVVDLPTGRVIRTIPAGDEPADVVFAGTPQRAFVTLAQLNQVRVFDPANPATPPITVPIQGEDPRALTVNAAGSTVFVAIFESGNRSTLVPRPAVSAPNGPYGGQNPPPNSGNVFDPPIAPDLDPPPPVGQIVKQASDGTWRDDNDGNWSAQVTWGLHDQDVAMIDANTLSVTFAKSLMTIVAGIAVTPAGDVTTVGIDSLNEIRFESNLNGVFVRSQFASFDPAAPTAVTIADLNPHLTYTSPSVPPAEREQSIGDPRGIVWHPSGTQAYVTGMGSNNVAVIDAAGARLSLIDVGQGPTGLALTADGATLYVLNKFEGSLSVIDTAANAESARINFFDPTPAAIKLGRPFLYDTHLTSGLGQASCASCHVDARTDRLAWDLGNPQGEMKEVNQPCRQGPGNCSPWHPMKGPMVTQTLLGIVNHGPFHWRGDREDVAAFAPAYTDIQGADAAPSADELQLLTDFVASLTYPPSPNRNLDGSLPPNLPVSNGNGNPQIGQNIYLNQPILGGALTCVACHALPSGTDGTIDDPPVGPVNQSLKVAQLRGMYDKTGTNKLSLTSNAGFGFNHDGDQDTLFTLLSGPGFVFPPGAVGQQQRRDLEAFMLALDTDTPAGVGRQITFNGPNNNNPMLVGQIGTMIAMADAGQVGLVVKGRQGGLDRGFAYIGFNVFASDRGGSFINTTVLRTAAGPGNELTWTVVPAGTQLRIGVDRDGDSFFDRDELDAGSNPADATSIPSGAIGQPSIVAANPPPASPFGPGAFRDVLDTGTGGSLTRGIGGVTTPPQGPVSYATISVTFNAPPATPPTPANTNVSCTGTPEACPTITEITGAGAGPYILALSGPIPPGQCTTLTLSSTFGAQALRYQSQPGNASLDLLTNTQDLLALIQAINNGSANQGLNLTRFNIDRSPGPAPVNTQDLLRLVQLLNGTNTTQPFNAAGVAPCP